jgi:single-strand DNA-binding protein
MNIINISLTVNFVESFTDIPGQQPFSIAQCSYIQLDREGNPVEHLVTVKGFNNSYDKTSSGICSDRLSMFKSGMKMLVTGQFFTELRDKDTKQIVEQPYILTHSVCPVKLDVSYNSIYLAGKMMKMPEKKTYESGKSSIQTSLLISERKKGYFYNITAWNKQGETIERYCRKGENLGIEGTLVFETWADKTTGEPRTGIKITANKVRLMGSKDAQSEYGTPPDEF